MRAAARGMRALGIAPDLVLTSPLVRCRQTAEIVCEALGGTPVDDPRLTPGMRLGDLEDALRDHPGAQAPLVCGHEPDLSEIVAELTGGGVVEFKKGGLAVLDVDSLRPGGGRLRALYPPAALRLLGG
jgi:phosphohistidine phosphatase